MAYQFQKRMRLYGKDATDEEIAKEVSKLRLGAPKRGIEPLSITQITKKLGYNSRTTIYQYQELAIQLGFLKIDSEGKPILPEKTHSQIFKKFTEDHPILQDSLIDYWWQKQLNKKGGKGTVIAKQILNMLERICNTLKINPEELIQSKEATEQFRDNYLAAYREGKDVRVVDTRSRGNIETVAYRCNYALASFCAVHGITWERGSSEMSRKIVGHGKYAEIRLTPEEFEKADKFLIDNYGIDSNEYRWFWVGVESCARFLALFHMKLEFESSISKENKETLIMEAIESKTKHLKDGKWTKYIQRPNTIKSLKLLKERGGTRIYETDLPKNRFQDSIVTEMKKLYQFLGKDKESIFFTKPTHVLRHLGAHYWLEKGNYTNHVLVAKIGGWHTIDELKKSYGEIPASKVLEEIEKFA